MVSAALATGADALGRYIFSSPLMGAVEVMEWYFMPALFLFPLALVQREKRNIRVTIAVSRLGIKTRKVLDILRYVMALGITAILAWYGYLVTYTDFIAKNRIQAPFTMFLYPTSFIVALSLSLLVIQFTIDLVQTIRKKELLEQD